MESCAIFESELAAILDFESFANVQRIFSPGSGFNIPKTIL